MPVTLNVTAVNKEALISPDIVKTLSKALFPIEGRHNSGVQITAREILWLLIRVSDGSLSAADIEQKTLTVHKFTAADECGVAAKYYEIAISAPGDRTEPIAICFASRSGRFLGLETVPEHFRRH